MVGAPLWDFFCGCAVAYLNFHWLKRWLPRLPIVATEPGQPQSQSAVEWCWLLASLRLMALGAYVIFTVLPASLYGAFCRPVPAVAAIACEAAYEGWLFWRAVS